MTNNSLSPKPIPIPELKEFLSGLTPDARESFAERCETSVGHLRNIAYGFRPCGEKLAVLIDRESAGFVPCEKLRPDVDWPYLRGSLKPDERKCERAM